MRKRSYLVNLQVTIGALNFCMELVSSAGRLFAVFARSVQSNGGAEHDLYKYRVVLPVRGMSALTAEEIQDADARGHKSADDQKPEEEIIRVHAG